MGLLKLLLSVAAVIMCFKVLLLAITWFKLRGQRFRVGASRLADATDVDPALAPVYAAGARALQGLGFVYSHTSLDEPFERAGKPSARQVFRHAETETWASVFPAAVPSAELPFGLSFATYYPDGIVRLTLDQKDTLGLYKPSKILLADGPFADAAQQWEAHRAGLPTGRPESFDPQTHLDRARALLQEELRAGAEKQFLLRDGLTDEWRFSAGGALKGAWLSLKSVAKPARARDRSPAVRMEETEQAARVAADLAAFERIDKPGAPKPSTMRRKTLVFLASALAFVVVGGFLWSWSVLPSLLIVILLHEFGHFAGMKMFGYQNSSVFFIPFFGAAVTGRKENVRAYQEAIVYLLGPVPGLILGLALGALCFGLPDVLPSDFLSVLAIMLVSVNFFNLLPIAPLDGGRLVELLFLSRFPRIKFVFLLLSALAFAAAYLHTHDTVLLILAMAMGFGLPVQWRAASLVNACRARLADGADEPARRRAVFAVLNASRHAGLAPGRRYGLAQILLAQLRCSSPGWATRLAGGFAYMAALLLPIAAAAVFLIRTVGYDGLSLALDHSDENMARQMERRVAAAATEQERWMALMHLGAWHTLRGQPERSRGYYTQALTLAEAGKDDASRGNQVRTLSVLAEVAPDAAEARRLYEEALARARQGPAPDVDVEVSILLGMARSRTMQPAQEEQIALLERACELARGAGGAHTDGGHYGLVMLAETYEQAGRPADAERCLVEYDTQAGATLYGRAILAEFLERQGRVDDALKAIELATAADVTAGHAAVVAELDAQQGWLLAGRGDWSGAQRCFGRARGRSEQQGNAVEDEDDYEFGLMPLVDLSGLALLRNDEPAARAAYRVAIARIRSSGLSDGTDPELMLATMVHGNTRETNVAWRVRRAAAHGDVLRKFQPAAAKSAELALWRNQPAQPSER